MGWEAGLDSRGPSLLEKLVQVPGAPGAPRRGSLTPPSESTLATSDAKQARMLHMLCWEGVLFYSETPLELLQPDGSNQNSTTTEGEGRSRLTEVAGQSVDEALHENICLSSPGTSIQSRTVHSNKLVGS